MKGERSWLLENRVGTASTPARYRLVTLLLIAWSLLLLFTHTAARSPYTAADEHGQLAHGDARTVFPVTRFFYDGTPPDYAVAHNLKLPAHSFLVATVGAFVRPYLTANDVANAVALALLIFCAVRLAERRAIPPPALFVSLATVLALPPFVGYAGQAMHYTVGMVVNFLVVIAAAAMTPDELRNPVVAGAIVALLAVGYDPYVFVLAFVLLLAKLRFRRRVDDLLFVAAAVIPPVLWHLFLNTMSRGRVSDDVRERFVYAVIVEWAGFFEAPGQRLLLPFVATHVGAHVALQQVIALIPWPLVCALLAALWIGRPRLRDDHGTTLLLLLLAGYFLEQLATAAFDWENNPRRALPVVIAFAFAWTWAVHRFFADRHWRLIFVGLLGITAFFAFADVAFERRAPRYPYTGEMIRSGPKVALLDIDSPPRTVARIDAEATLLSHFSRVRHVPSLPFAAAQLFGAAIILTLVWILARARLVPRYAPAIAAAVILASAVRFVL